MIKTLLTTLKQDKETFEVPKSVQDAIPIRRCLLYTSDAADE